MGRSFTHSVSIYYIPTVCRNSGEWKTVFDLVELKVKRGRLARKQGVLLWCVKCCYGEYMILWEHWGRSPSPVYGCWQRFLRARK